MLAFWSNPSTQPLVTWFSFFPATASNHLHSLPSFPFLPFSCLLVMTAFSTLQRKQRLPRPLYLPIPPNPPTPTYLLRRRSDIIHHLCTCDWTPSVRTFSACSNTLHPTLWYHSSHGINYSFVSVSSARPERSPWNTAVWLHDYRIAVS